MSNGIRERIMEEAEKLFNRYGIRSITMDEIARHLGISKKTLYQWFENKDELVYGISQAHTETDCANWERVQAMGGSALDEMLEISNILRKEVEGLNPSLVYDLQRFYPRAWQLFEQQRESVFERTIEYNILRGIREGYYRKDLNVKILSRMRVDGVLRSFNPDIFPPETFQFAVVQHAMLDHFIHGLLTDKGQKEWHELLHRQKIEAEKNSSLLETYAHKFDSDPNPNPNSDSNSENKSDTSN
jgi:TetR/AcrR family transcriptional regulator, cholesterol catabolism regulator